MRKAIRTLRVIRLLYCVTAVGCAGIAPPSTPTISPSSTAKPAEVEPDEDWPASPPQAQGMDSILLDQGFGLLDQEPYLTSMIIVRNDTVVFEKYYNDNTKNQSVDIQSVTKSIISALVGIAIREGYIKGVDQKLSEFFPDYFPRKDDPRKNDLALRHLLTMSAGFDWQDGPPFPPDIVGATLDLPFKTAPGKAFSYNSCLPQIVSALITKESKMSTREIAVKYLFGPLGIAVRAWDQPNGIYNGCCHLFLTLREMAKIGSLFLHRGNWNGRQIIPAEWVEESTSFQIKVNENAAYGYYWWLHTVSGRRVFSALGLWGQFIVVIPDFNMVMVATGKDPRGGKQFDGFGFIEKYLIPSIKTDG
jgi:CubicO group peptidase (beta-lactamase class C family)